MSGSSSVEGRPGASPYTSSVEIWRIRFRSFLRPASRTDQVPITSVRTKSPASRMDRSTWVSAAKWTRASADFVTRSMSFRSHTSPWTNVRFRSSLYSLRLFGFPAYVSLSTTTTSSLPVASRRRTKQLPMKPMPPVTTRRAMTSSLHLDVPIVWDVLRIVGDAELVRLFVVVQLRREVHEVHRFRSDRLETVDDVRRDLDHHGVPLARKELVHLAFRRGPVAIVVADDLCRPAHHDEMIRLLLVIVPALHDPRIPDRHVRLREPVELRPVGAEHFHEVAPLVVNLFERPDDDALNQIHGGFLVFGGATYSFTSKGFWPAPLCGRRGARPRCGRDGAPRTVPRPRGASARAPRDRDPPRSRRPRRRANRVAPPRHSRCIRGEHVGPQRQAESRAQHSRDDGCRSLRGRPGRSEVRERNRGRTFGLPLERGGGGLRPFLDGLRLRWIAARNGGHGTSSVERVRGDEALRGTRGSQSARRANRPSPLFGVRLEPVVSEDERRDVGPPETRGGPGSSPVFGPKSDTDVREDRRGGRLRPLGSTRCGGFPRELPGLCLSG